MGSSECETNTDVESLTGPQIKALRRGMGISQTEMGKRIGCSRHAISYWETKPIPMRHRELKCGVPAQVLKILGVSVMPYSPRSNARERGGVLLPGLDTNTRARGGGVLQDSQQEWIDRECARINAKAMERAARYRQQGDRLLIAHASAFGARPAGQARHLAEIQAMGVEVMFLTEQAEEICQAA